MYAENLSHLVKADNSTVVRFCKSANFRKYLAN